MAWLDAMNSPLHRICADCESTPSCKETGCLNDPSFHKAADTFWDDEFTCDAVEADFAKAIVWCGVIGCVLACALAVFL